MIPGEKRVDTRQRTIDGGSPDLRVGLEEQVGGEDVGVDPGVPVIGRPSIGARCDAQPHPVIDRPVWFQDPRANFALDSIEDNRELSGKGWAQQVMRPGQQRSGFGGEQVNDGKGGVRQAALEATAVTVRGDPPETLFAECPDAIDDVIEKATLGLDTFGQDKLDQRFPALEVGRLVAAAIAIAREVEEHRCRERRPLHAQPRLCTLHEAGPGFPRDRRPSIAIVDRGVWSPRFPFDQRFAHQYRGEAAGQD